MSKGRNLQQLGLQELLLLLLLLLLLQLRPASSAGTCAARPPRRPQPPSRTGTGDGGAGGGRGRSRASRGPRSSIGRSSRRATRWQPARAAADEPRPSLRRGRRGVRRESPARLAARPSRRRRQWRRRGTWGRGLWGRGGGRGGRTLTAARARHPLSGRGPLWPCLAQPNDGLSSVRPPTQPSIPLVISRIVAIVAAAAGREPASTRALTWAVSRATVAPSAHHLLLLLLPRPRRRPTRPPEARRRRHVSTAGLCTRRPAPSSGEGCTPLDGPKSV